MATFTPPIGEGGLDSEEWPQPPPSWLTPLSEPWILGNSWLEAPNTVRALRADLPSSLHIWAWKGIKLSTQREKLRLAMLHSVNSTCLLFSPSMVDNAGWSQSAILTRNSICSLSLGLQLQHGSGAAAVLELCNADAVRAQSRVGLSNTRPPHNIQSHYKIYISAFVHALECFVLWWQCKFNLYQSIIEENSLLKYS